MRTQGLLSRKLTSVLAILMITSGLQALVTTTPASATNPVGSIQFSGNGSMVYSTGAPGSQNTTIEFWMKQTSTGGIQRIFTTSWSFGPSNVTIRTQGNTCLVVAVANVELSLTSGTNYACPTVNAWHHIALVGLGTTWNLYVDGVLARTTTWTEASKPNITDGDAWIGGWANSERFNGYVSNIRYVIGTAIYTSNFSSPSPPLAATQSAGGSGVGAISSGTKLLLNTRYNNTLATAQADTSGDGRTPTVYGTPVASSESPPIAAPSSTTLSASSSTPTYGETVTLSATIKDGGATATGATGTVNFKNNGTSITGCATSTITSGVAQCAFLPASASTFSNLTAEYSGGSAYASSIASAIEITVSKANQATLSVANQNFWAHQNVPLSSWTPTGGSGTGALTYAVTSGPCTISSGTLYGNPTGPNGPKVCTLTVTKSEYTNYNAITSA